MVDETDSPEEKRTTGPAEDTQILSVTPGMLVDYLNEQRPGVMCFYCGKTEYAIPADPMGKSAAVVTTPIPHAPGIGSWMYIAICPTCGHMTMFNAHIVSRKILGQK